MKRNLQGEQGKHKKSSEALSITQHITTKGHAHSHPPRWSSYRSFFPLSALSNLSRVFAFKRKWGRTRKVGARDRKAEGIVEGGSGCGKGVCTPSAWYYKAGSGIEEQGRG